MPTPDSAPLTVISGLRYCAAAGSIQDWEEGEAMGCHWCSPETFDQTKHSEVAILNAR